MDGGHSHGGDGSGAHSHGYGGGSSGASPQVAVIGFVLGIAIGIFTGGATYIGQHTYEAMYPVDIVHIHGDWAALFFTIGVAIIFGAAGSLLLIVAISKHSGGALAAGCAAIVVAAACWFVLAPRYEVRVVERSPTNSSSLRPAAAIRQVVPKKVRLSCDDIDNCKNGRVFSHSTISLTVHGISSTLYDQLCTAGYSDEWRSNQRPIMDSADRNCNWYGRPWSTENLQAEFDSPQHPGRWTVTWRLKDPTGKVVASSTYKVAVARNPYE
jgi:hypothetical protein